MAGSDTARGMGIASSYNVVRGTRSPASTTRHHRYGPPLRRAVQDELDSREQIGTDPHRHVTAGFGNIGDGIFLGDGASGELPRPEQRHQRQRLCRRRVLPPTNRGNVVFATTSASMSPARMLGNGELGVLFTRGATWNAIGGQWGGNYIAGNPYGGISMGQSNWGPANANWVQNNVIGLNVDGVVMGGQQVGVSINSGSKANLVEGNTIGHGPRRLPDFRPVQQSRQWWSSGPAATRPAGLTRHAHWHDP